MMHKVLIVSSMRELRQRTHTCGTLGCAQVNQTVTLMGWVQSLRDHGGLCFIDLRDREGITQLVLDPNKFQEALTILKPESVIEVCGIVQRRPRETVNKRIATGEIEVQINCIEVHNICQTLPFPLDDKADKVSEDLRFTYRYLDLRRKINQDRLQLRHRASMVIRNYLNDKGFFEIETPILFKSTPEGAREFLVPSRLNPGQCYALTQSPQQYKQMLMVAGVERYFSLARCFRDEDLRADRQPEFTQMDLEASFIDREDIYTLIEGLVEKLWHNCLGTSVKTPFLRMTFKDAMNRFGSDKPDMRFRMELQDVSTVFQESKLQVFANVIAKGGVVKALRVVNFADVTTGELNTLEQKAKDLGAQGLAFVKVKSGEWKSPLTKFLSDAEKQALLQTLDIQEGDCLFFMAGSWEKACTILGKIRLEIGSILEKRGILTISPSDHKFLWVVDFPLLTFDEEQNKYVATHHPFTAPLKADVSLLKTDPQKVRGQHYDLVLNGTELGGGSIRIHSAEIQQFIFEEVLQLAPEVVENRFGYLLKAFKFGAPPHGGIALGFDRLVALMVGTHSIRDVIAFPKTQKGQDLMSMSPGYVDNRQLEDLNLQFSFNTQK